MTNPLWRGIGILLLTMALISGAARTAFSQSPQGIELSVSYQRLPDASLDWSGMRRETAARGWRFDVAFPLTPIISLVGAVDASSGQQTRRASGIFTSGSVHNTWTDTGYVAGLRWRASQLHRMVPFAQGSTGVVQSRQTTEYHTVPPLGSFGGTNYLWLVDLGAGVNVMITRHLGARVGGDLRIDPVVAAAGGDATMGRVHAGVVFTFP